MKNQVEFKNQHMEFQPVNDRVVLKKIQVEQKTQGGILIPVTEDRPSDTIYAKIIAVGNGRWEDGGRVPLTAQVGDIVILRPNMALNHEHMGEEYLIIREGELLSIVKGVVEAPDGYEYKADAFKEEVRQLESLL